MITRRVKEQLRLPVAAANDRLRYPTKASPQGYAKRPSSALQGRQLAPDVYSSWVRVVEKDIASSRGSRNCLLLEESHGWCLHSGVVLSKPQLSVQYLSKRHATRLLVECTTAGHRFTVRVLERHQAYSPGRLSTVHSSTLARCILLIKVAPATQSTQEVTLALWSTG